jgi:predicted Zn-dependent protease
MNNLGAALLNAKAYDEAEHYLQRALEERPGYAEPQKNLAILYRKQGKDDQAVEAYQRYVDQRPDDVETRQTYAIYLTKLGRWEEAAKVLEQLTEEVTDVPVLFFLLARVENHNNQPEKAMAALQRGIELSDPRAALAYMDDKEFEQLRSSDKFQELIQTLQQSEKK